MIAGINAITLMPVISSTLRFVMNRDSLELDKMFMNLVSSLDEEKDLYNLKKGFYNRTQIGKWIKKLRNKRY